MAELERLAGEAFGVARQARIRQHLMVPMRDGTKLATNIMLPLAPGRYPTVLVRTAYNRQGHMSGNLHFPAQGVAFVVQDCRGRYESEGVHDPFRHEADDGEDMLAWIASQPWSDGRVGAYGDSYLAATQFAMAPRGGQTLVALNPRFMSGDCWRRAYYADGVFSLALTWSWLCLEVGGRVSKAADLPLYDSLALLRHRPLLTLDEASGAGVVPAYRDYVTQDHWGPFWHDLSVYEQLHEYRMPVLLTAGWYDYYPGEAIRVFQELRRLAPTPELRAAHRLLIGPWSHGVNPRSTLGERDFGPAALRENDATSRWLLTLLKGGTPAAFQAAPVRVFTMGLNDWRDFSDWPPPGMQVQPWYLHADGELSPVAPSGTAAPATYDYDPANPVPTLGGNHSVGPYNPGLYEHCRPGPFNQAPVEARPDVLCWTSAPLAADLDLTGPVTVRLVVSSSASDTDFVARLCEVTAEDQSFNLTEGILRVAFRHGNHQPPSPLPPGEVVELEILLEATSAILRRGQRLRLQVTSSGFPLWAPNPNTGEGPATAVRTQVARQSIYQDATRASRLLLPVLPPS